MLTILLLKLFLIEATIQINDKLQNLFFNIKTNETAVGF